MATTSSVTNAITSIAANSAKTASVLTSIVSQLASIQAQITALQSAVTALQSKVMEHD